MKINQNALEYIKENYPKNGSKEIMKRYSLSKTTLRSIVRKLKIRLLDGVFNKICIEARFKPIENYPVDARKFIKVVSPEVAYLLGFLWADGYILQTKKISYVVALKIVEKDANDLKNLFDMTGKWNFCLPRKEKEEHQQTCKITTSNKFLHDFLRENDYGNKHGVEPKKILSKIPNNLHNYFFRGLFDGDGCLYVKNSKVQATIASVYDQNWDFVKKILEKLDVKYRVVRTISNVGNKSSIISITGKTHTLKFMDYLYNNKNLDKIGMNRKYDKYLLINRERKNKEFNTVYKYVYLYKSGKYVVRITKNKQNNLKEDLYLGSFNTKEEAIKTVDNFLSKNNLTIDKNHGIEFFYNHSQT